ncbi:MAG: hypothetical protein HY898_22845 [Deltaproteobacteria bacterium]|nr:hypothetical protein [Deltaproteobacteria bacterium]
MHHEQANQRERTVTTATSNALEAIASDLGIRVIEGNYWPPYLVSRDRPELTVSRAVNDALRSEALALAIHHALLRRRVCGSP